MNLYDVQTGSHFLFLLKKMHFWIVLCLSLSEYEAFWRDKQEEFHHVPLRRPNPMGNFTHNVGTLLIKTNRIRSLESLVTVGWQVSRWRLN